MHNYESQQSSQHVTSMPAISLGECISEYDNATGTLSVVFSRDLRTPEIAGVDGLQIRRGECWVVGYLIEIGFAGWAGNSGNPGGDWPDLVDGWPQKIYPYLSNNSSSWPKLAIDLTNPPASFTSNPDTQAPPM